MNTEVNEVARQQAGYREVEDIGSLGTPGIASHDYLQQYEAIKHFKADSLLNNVADKGLQQTGREEQQIHRQWRENFERLVREDKKDPFEASVFSIYRADVGVALAISLLGLFAHCLTFYLLFRVYTNILGGQLHSVENKYLIGGVIVCRLLRMLCSYVGEDRLNKVGLRMYRLGANCLLKKSLQCSPLSNKDISETLLSKLMHTDCESLLIYPAKMGLAVENIMCMLITSGLTIYIAGLPGLVGILLLLASLFLRTFFKSLISSVEKKINLRSKQRIQSTIEMFNIVKLIKTNALESYYFNRMRQTRGEEVVQLKVKLLFEMIQSSFILIIKPTIVAVIFKLIAWQGGLFHSDVLFTVSSCVNLFNVQAVLNAYAYIDMIQTAHRNIEHFLKAREMDYSHLTRTNCQTSVAVEIKGGDFEWEAATKEHSEQTQSPKQGSQFRLRGIELEIKRGELVALVGGYGSGKSSLANCLLGEMTRKGDPRVRIDGPVAYASQVPWIMNETIRSNILFGRDYDEKKYREALKYSSLKADLPLFPNRDLSVIGKRGSTLSGGQKARVSLARALYSNADVYIFDDILSAVDAHVGAFLFSMTIKHYLQGKTILLITHSLFYVSHTDRILIFEDGAIQQAGSFEQLSSHRLFARIEPTQLKREADYEGALSARVGLGEAGEAGEAEAGEAELFEEEVGIWDSFKAYIRRNSGAKFAVLMSLFIFVIAGIVAYTQIMLNQWALSNDARSGGYFQVQLLLNVFKFMLALLMTWVMYSSDFLQSLHDDMVRSLLFSPLSYFERTPSDKIINRFSSSMSTNDRIMTSELGFMLANLQLTLSYLFVVIYLYCLLEHYLYVGCFFLLSAAVLLLFHSYFGVGMRINKLERELLIPINSKYSEMVDGLTTIRAYDQVQTILHDFWRNINIFSSANLAKSAVDAKLKLIIIGAPNLLIILQLSLIFFLDTTFHQYTIFLIYAYFGFEDSLMRFYQGLAAFAPRLESLGKCEQLTGLDPEPGYVQYLRDNYRENEPFPAVHFQQEVFPRGEVAFNQFSLRYKPELDDVLKRVTFTVRAGEKIGIVGRTGSGKSTMMLGLLRIVEASGGSIVIDGVDIATLSLEQLRSNINIILQDHFMFSGSVRENVDPTNSHSDEKVEEALRMCGIWEDFQAREGIETVVAEGGGNLSSGEKQLLNIARSLLSPKRIVLIDEATASIDIETDALIQKVIRKHFAGRTVLTIAHRINTVVDSDRVLVLRDGAVLEFDSPSALLARKDSVFFKLHLESGKVKEE